MNNFLKAFGIFVVGTVVGVLVTVSFGANKASVSGVYNQVQNKFAQGAKFGLTDQTVISNTGSITLSTTGTEVTRINKGTCYIKAYATTIVGSSTATVDCQGTAAVSASGMSALTGVTSGDTIVATLSTTTAAGGAAAPVLGGLVASGAVASSTSGYITLTIANLTGGTYTWPLTGQATGTVNYFVVK